MLSKSLFVSLGNHTAKGKRMLTGSVHKARGISITKRQRFVIVVLILSIGLFFTEHFFSRSTLLFAVFLSVLTNVLLFVTNYKDIRSNFSWPLFILPFFFSLAFGMFYFLAPARLTTRLLMTSLYAIGLYALFLCQNIFTVASIRTISLLAGARIVSFIITLVSFFFLTNVVFTLDIPVVPTALLIFLYSFFLILQALWSITLEKSIVPQLLWILGLSICIFEVSLILWYWPSSPTIIALFLTGLFYILVGPSQVWLDKRLFRGVMWEYVWVTFAIVVILVGFTAWKG